MPDVFTMFFFKGDDDDDDDDDNFFGEREGLGVGLGKKRPSTRDFPLANNTSSPPYKRQNCS